MKVVWLHRAPSSKSGRWTRCLNYSFNLLLHFCAHFSICFLLANKNNFIALYRVTGGTQKLETENGGIYLKFDLNLINLIQTIIILYLMDLDILKMKYKLI